LRREDREEKRREEKRREEKKTESLIMELVEIRGVEVLEDFADGLFIKVDGSSNTKETEDIG